MASGLSLKASTGNGACESSTHVTYGATIDDYAEQDIKLDTQDATISNAFSGSGNLPLNTLSISDVNGNYAYVSRSVSGTSGSTRWNYNWNTYRPYSSTLGSGVGAQLWLTATNAYSIYGYGYASNREGDKASASTQVGSSSPYLTSSLSNYYVNPTAYTTEARVYQKANSATSTGSINVQGWTNNLEKDYSTTWIKIPKGTINSPTTNTYSGRTSSWVYPTASTVSTTGSGNLYAYASNLEGDSSKFNLQLTNGKVTNPNFYAWSGTQFAETWASIPQAYGAVTEISSQGLDKALGYQEHWVWNSGKGDYDRISTKVERGEGDFVAKKTNNYAFNNVYLTTRATKSDISITPTGFGANTALILDPRRWEITVDQGGRDIRDPVMNSLKSKGYAVTYYSDSAVSKEKVAQMDDHRLSAINTHTSPTLFYLSKSSNGVTWDRVNANELNNWFTKSNGMTVFIGCSSFADIGTGTLAAAVSEANVRGGTTKSWGLRYVNDFEVRFFDSLSKGNTISYANNYAKGYDAYDRSSGKNLRLLGNTAFKL